MQQPPFQQFLQKLGSPWRFRLFLLANLPSAWMAGLRLERLTPQQAVISIRYGWFNKNPFRSVYVAILAMPAEVSTGILCMSYLYGQAPVSMLVVSSEARYLKKATGKVCFTCSDGERVAAAVQQALATGEAVTVDCHTTGTNSAGEVVATFTFTWSLKRRSSQAPSTASQP